MDKSTEKSINRAKELIADDDNIQELDTRIQEIDTKIKQLDVKPKPKKARRRKTAGESFDSSITQSIQRLQPKKRGRKK
jgi:hypothetical protein